MAKKKLSCDEVRKQRSDALKDFFADIRLMDVVDEITILNPKKGKYLVWFEKDYRVVYSILFGEDCPKLIKELLGQREKLCCEVLNEKPVLLDFDAVDDDMLNISVKNWYVNDYPEDSIGQCIFDEVTFGDVIALFKKGKAYRVYDELGVSDSVFRERLFERVAYILACTYEDVYNAWINSVPTRVLTNYNTFS